MNLTFNSDDQIAFQDFCKSYGIEPCSDEGYDVRQNMAATYHDKDAVYWLEATLESKSRKASTKTIAMQSFIEKAKLKKVQFILEDDERRKKMRIHLQDEQKIKSSPFKEMTSLFGIKPTTARWDNLRGVIVRAFRDPSARDELTRLYSDESKRYTSQPCAPGVKLHPIPPHFDLFIEEVIQGKFS